jgi:NDP-sugar pyrophosphorylase family protein
MILVLAVPVKSIKNVAVNRTMTLLILAAGFGTRLEPRTISFPKHLLPVGNSCVMDFFYNSVEKTNSLFDKRVLITNEIYFKHFKTWANSKKVKIKVISNGVTKKIDKIGAIGDFLLSCKREEISEDVFVVAPDYVLEDVDLEEVIKFSNQKRSSVTLFRTEKDKGKLKAGSCLLVDKDGKVIKFEEKPQEPFSENYGVPYYLIKKKDIGKIAKIPDELQDNSGQIVAELVKSSLVYGFRYDGSIIHLTSEQDYQEILNKY